MHVNTKLIAINGEAYEPDMGVDTFLNSRPKVLIGKHAPRLILLIF